MGKNPITAHAMRGGGDLYPTADWFVGTMLGELVHRVLLNMWGINVEPLLSCVDQFPLGEEKELLLCRPLLKFILLSDISEEQAPRSILHCSPPFL